MQKSGKKMGRPVKGEPKDVSLHLRISKTDDRRLKACSDWLGIPRAEVLSKAVELLEQKLTGK